MGNRPLDSKSRLVSVVVRTTGFRAGVDEPVLIALAEIKGLKTDPDKAVEILIKPTQKMRPEARAEFNIDHQQANKIMEEGLDPQEALKKIEEFIGDSALVAHSDLVSRFAPFLLKKSNGSERTLIDSARLARHIWKAGEKRKGFPLETHKVFELKYWLGIEPDTYNEEPTKAFTEAIVIGAVFAQAAKKYLKLEGKEPTVEGIAEFAREPIPVEVWPKAPHKGVSLKELDLDFIKRQLDRAERADSEPEIRGLDRDLRHALEQEMSQRLQAIEEQAKNRTLFAKRSSGSIFGSSF